MTPRRWPGAAVVGLAVVVAAAVPAVADDRERALDLNEAAVARYQAGEPQAALDLLREALRLAPDEPTIRHNASRCLVALGDAAFAERRFADAARDYHEAAGLVPEDPGPALREAAALYEGLQDRDVVALLEPLLNDFPEEAWGHELLAKALYRLGENARAIERWERALELDPANAAVAEALERARREEAVEEDLYVDLGAAHFTIKYDGRQDAAIGRRVVEVLESAYQEVGGLLNRYPDAEVAVVVYPGRTFSAATGAHGWVAGLYDGKIRVPADGLAEAPAAEVRRVLTHEYAHALLRATGGPRVPAWLHEGFAQVAEGRPRDRARRGLRQGSVPSVGDLSKTFVRERDADEARRLYDAACDFVYYLIGRGGTPLLAELLDALGRNDGLDEAMERLYGDDLEGLFAAWRSELPR